ncbi:sensor domain-containing protein [Micromonospora okii]|uniref:sensor domain-containing protein n=1 Tax=Micromonospora okii TaxID=1182970 RepID=UPI001E56B6F4|nr:sensor domain-containing protein [Micromonospora okii]
MTQAPHPGIPPAAPGPHDTGPAGPPPTYVNPAGPPPGGPPRPLLSRPIPPLARRVLLIAGVAAVAAAVLLAGVGWWVWHAVTRSHAVPGTVQASVLDAEEVSRIVGVTLAAETRAGEPAPALAADPLPCEVAVGPATRAVYGRSWTAFLSVTHQESREATAHVVTQVVGRYADAGQAAKAFRILTDGLRACARAVRTDRNEDTSTWSYRVDASTPDALGWTATQDAGDGWACHRAARLRDRSLVQAAVCQAGDGRAAAARIGDLLATRVEG